MNLINLDAKTREYMQRELDLDLAQGRLYLSRRLTEKGRSDYPGLLREALAHYEPDWLAEQLARQRRMAAFELSRSRRGRPFAKFTPQNDAEQLAYGEFNRFYMRGLCARAIDEGIDHLIVYRARGVRQPRASSLTILGQQVDPRELLADLRENNDRTTRLGIPGGPNSGISVRLP